MSSGYIPAPPPPALTLPKKLVFRETGNGFYFPTLILGLVLVLYTGSRRFAHFCVRIAEIQRALPARGVAVASSNPDVVRELGTPIVPGWYLSGSINVSGSSGNADMGHFLSTARFRPWYCVCRCKEDCRCLDVRQTTSLSRRPGITHQASCPLPRYRPKNEDK